MPRGPRGRAVKLFSYLLSSRVPPYRLFEVGGRLDREFMHCIVECMHACTNYVCTVHALALEAG